MTFAPTATTRPSPATALVTGGGGFLGRRIVDMLIERGDRVRIYARGTYPELARLGVDCRRGDLTDAEALKRACDGCDVVFHVAARAGIWGSWEDYHRPNVLGTQNVIAAVRSAGVPGLVYTSSPSVVFDGGDMEGVDESVPYARHFAAHYPRSKAVAEQMVRAAGDRALATVALRPHLIWGPRDNHLVPRIIARAHRLRRIGRANKLIDTTYIDNAARAHLCAADRLRPGSPLSGRAYFISNGRPLPTWDVINRILDCAGKPPIRRSIPRPAAILLAGTFETLYRALRVSTEPPLTRFVVEEMTTAHWFDITAARRDLDYSPEVDMDEGFSRLRAWLQSSSPTTHRLTQP